MSTTSLKLDYHYGSEADAYSFYRIPKILFIDKRFATISVDAKVLYGLMLDRMSLSIKNNWVDKENRVFIYFTLDDAIEMLGCGHTKIIKLLSELDTAKGIGLIERKKQGQGKPTIIYVKSFTSLVPVPVVEKTEECKQYLFPNFKTSQNEKSAHSQSRSLDFTNTDTNNTKDNNTEFNDTHSINLSAKCKKPWW